MLELTEKALRRALARLYDPPLTEKQILSIIRRMDKMTKAGDPEDYAFATAISRYKSNAKTPTF